MFLALTNITNRSGALKENKQTHFTFNIIPFVKCFYVTSNFKSNTQVPLIITVPLKRKLTYPVHLSVLFVVKNVQANLNCVYYEGDIDTPLESKVYFLIRRSRNIQVFRSHSKVKSDIKYDKKGLKVKAKLIVNWYTPPPLTSELNRDLKYKRIPIRKLRLRNSVIYGPPSENSYF